MNARKRDGLRPKAASGKKKRDRKSNVLRPKLKSVYSQLKQEIERQEHESHSLSPRPTSSGKAKLRRTTPLARVIVLAAAGIAMNTLGVLYDNGKGVAQD
jgi:hypothetical protein